jgi:hypothetical protein
MGLGVVIERGAFARRNRMFVSSKYLYVAGFPLVAALVAVVPGHAERATSAAATAAARMHSPRIRALTSDSATNWSGYAVNGANGSVTNVSGSWVVPQVVGGKPSQYSSFWVGIDGNTSNTVEQTGTDSDTDSNGNPVYFAWVEFYPKPPKTVPNPVHPGDVISASVSGSNGSFTCTITDHTQGWTYTTSAKVNKAQQNSAEWIAEAPWQGGVLPLADFGSVNFTACDATIGGVAAPIGAFDTATNSPVDAITMIGSGTPPNPAVKAYPTPNAPSLLGPTANAFTATWVATGP